MDEHDWLAERFEADRAHLRRWPTGCSALVSQADDPSNPSATASPT